MATFSGLVNVEETEPGALFVVGGGEGLVYECNGEGDKAGAFGLFGDPVTDAVWWRNHSAVVNRQGLDDTEKQLGAGATKVRSYTCNLADRAAIAATAAQTLADWGRVDVLINNAGVVSCKSLLEASEAEIQRTFDVNTLAPFWMTRAFLPGMLERDSGHVVTIPSAAGIVGTSRLVDYCSSKHAAVGFDESLRLELKRNGSRVVTTIVCPFYISTGMFEGVKTRFPLILPILSPDYAADRIVAAIRADKRRLLMPRFVYATWLARILPIPVFDAVMEFFGINKSMDQFTGRAGH